MKMIGLIGDMSWESTVTYYQLINEAVKEKLGGLHSAKILLYSVDFAQIEQYQISGMWEQSAELLTDAAKRFYCNLYEHHAQGCTADTESTSYTDSSYCGCYSRRFACQGDSQNSSAWYKVYHDAGFLQIMSYEAWD